MSKEIKVYNTEAFTIEKKVDKSGSEKVMLSGNAMPLNEISRNGVYYRPESVKKAVKSLEGNPFLFAHQQNEVRHILGKVEKSGINDTHVTYEVDIDPEEKEFIRKSEKGYIKNVSVGAIINPETVEIDEEKGTATVDVVEFAELSSAPVPGYKNTSADLRKEGVILLAESLGKEDLVEKLKKKTKETPDGEDMEEKKEENIEDNTENNTEDTQESEDSDDGSEKTVEEKLTEINTKVNELVGTIEEYQNRLSAIESKVDNILEEEEKESDDEEEESDEEDSDEEETKEQEISPDTSEAFTSDEGDYQTNVKKKEKELELNKDDNPLDVVNLGKKIKQNRRY